jgi:error-prone DNA polymerase
VLLAANLDGYANLCRILTETHLRDRDHPHAFLEDLSEYRDGLFCLTGATGSLLWELLDAGRLEAARTWVRELYDLFGERLSIEVAHHLLPGDKRRLQRLHALSKETGIPMAVTGDVRFAIPEHYRRYDLMTCIRNGITVFDPHSERPRNAEAYLKDEQTLRKLIPWPEAFQRTEEIAQACSVDLLPGYITPPAARVTTGETCREHLIRLCREGIERKYGIRELDDPATKRGEQRAPKAEGESMGSARARAEKQLRKELKVILKLQLEEYFLVVHEVVAEAQRRGIRCAGRGSAANSIVAFLLGITGVDPLKHRLLFERFLHGGRKGTPDIDVDFDSERREEIISWMEERFGMEQAAMTATLVTYRLRSALRDVAKALGWSMDEVNALSKAVPPSGAHHARDYKVTLEQVLRPSPLMDVLIEMAESLADCPRHLGLHSGGMVLSRKPLYQFTPVQVSANGVKMVQFDKYDVEALGLVKLDVLGLRMLASVSESVELIHRHVDPDFDLEAIPFDDIPTFNMIRASETLGTFQIESQGQLHLLAQHQPETFDDLITEIALFRPGPLQGGMVHPFVRRSRGEEKVEYDHPDLEPVLKDTYGIILFQEQVLEVAHKFAGMSLAEADDFRALMSRFRDPGEMEQMRGKFVQGAMRRGVDEESANTVFNRVSNFVGYGFCRSHAAAFAKTVYESCYLKKRYPAAFMAAIMQHRPGMYNLMTLQEEARRFGVTTLPPDVNRSGVRYDIELGEREPGPRSGSAFRIRKPLTSVKELSEDDASRILWERLTGGPFTSVENFYRRVALEEDALRGLARSGAFDAVARDSREALWEVGLLLRSPVPRGRQGSGELFEVRAFSEEDIPELPELTAQDRLSWDYETHGAGRMHPMTLMRRTLNELEIRSIETCYRFGRYFPVHGNGRWGNSAPGNRHPIVTVAGISVLRQRPPTAKGVLFVTLEDETGFVQCVVRPEVLEHLDHVLRQSALIVRGELHIQGNWRGLVVTNAWALNGIFGGYEGHPGQDGGRDRLVARVPAEEAGAVAED